ncbi:MAG TPA: outer membrane protein assembly factor BamD [Candidatus Acidoferrales bacterium]|nr:outer membrane protein assembly factor BamD [Candidatus Acidoferrales bacterium]
MRIFSKQSILWLGSTVLICFLAAGCAVRNNAAAKNQNSSAAPDKILYDRALNDYKHQRFIESRLNLETLINSYPDSEYLADAKLAVADSYYKEGGVDNLTQAVAAYKEYIVFFPFLDQAAYAQLQVGMSHYRMMEKADRDSTQAQLAEQELQTFLLKYPKSPLVPEAEQRLREVQEILGQGDYDVAHFYYFKGDYRAAVARLDEVTTRYPLFSQSDRAIWTLGDIYRHAARNSKNETERARWRNQSDIEYARLIREYPLSPLVGDAKRYLTQDGAKIPAPDPEALARAKYEEKFASQHPGIVHRAMGILHSSPDVSTAAHTGMPDLNPPGQIATPQSILQGTATTSSIVAQGANGGGSASENVNTQSTSSSSGAAVADPTMTSDPATTASPSVSEPIPTSNAAPPAMNTSTATDEAAAKIGPPTPQAKDAKTKQKKVNAPKANSKTESTSKKKKGIRKIMPW